MDVCQNLDQSKVLFFSVNTDDIGGPMEVAQELGITHVNFFTFMQCIYYSHV